MLQTISVYENRLSQLLAPGRVTPFALYLELTSLLSGLASLNPMNAITEIKPYSHDDCALPFTTTTNDIRSFISTEGGVTYTRLDFAPTDDGAYLFAPLNMNNIVNVNEVYLAVRSSASEEDLVRALETGDTFKLVNPGAKNVRVRGARVEHIRYPPRFLPVMNGCLWFRLLLAESSRVWYEMCQEKGVLIDWARDLYPDISVSLFITRQDTAAAA